jgi:hypothetical protein
MQHTKDYNAVVERSVKNYVVVCADREAVDIFLKIGASLTGKRVAGKQLQLLIDGIDPSHGDRSTL